MKQENREKIKKEMSYRDLLSICIGKAFANQKNFQDFLGTYHRWDTDVTQGVLLIDEKVFEVEYIGTTSKRDLCWYTAEQEQIIPDEGVQIMMRIREFLKEKEVPQFYFPKAKLTNEINEHNLAMIFCMLADQKVCYFNGSGEVSIVMFVKNLPETIFQPVSADRFFHIVMYLIQNYDIHAREMIHSFLLENDTDFLEEENKIIGFFENGNEIEFQFEGEKLVHIEGNLKQKNEEETSEEI